ncbi:MAG: right-handed parallel beta-helix repeat-containing protein [bacterium]
MAPYFKFMKRCFLLFLLTLSGCGFFRSTLNVPGDFFFIQDALNFANSGDTVTVDCGTYSPSQTGEIFPLFIPDGVSLKGSSSNCVLLDAQNSAGVLNVSNYSGGTISGLAIVNGLANNGGGIFLSNVSNLTLQDNVFQGNQATNLGSALWITNSGNNVVIQNNLFDGNMRGSSGATPASLQISNSQVSFFNNVVSFGDGNGLQLDNNATGTFENNIFYKNGSNGQGFGLNDTTPSGNTKVAYNLFFGNVQNDISVGGNSVTAAQANALSGSDQFSNNSTADPLFNNPTNGDYSLQSSSPARNAGDPASQFNNLNGSRNDQGIFGGQNPIY